MAAEPITLTLPPPGEELDDMLAALPEIPAVFLLSAAAGRPYLAKTALLGRRVRRLLKANDRFRAALNLRGVVDTLAYWPTASRLESALTFYRLARHHHPAGYVKLCNLRMPSYMKVLSSNEFPRTQVTTRLGGRGPAYGPFRSRAQAEQFEAASLDLFQIRRCQEELHPSPDHPGCIYGEMAQCLRPCQQAVTVDEYASEAERFVEFLTTQGRSLAETVERIRDRYSAEMEFEEAARQHKRLERIHAVWKLRDELVSEAGALSGVAVLKALQPGCVTLLVLARGAWNEPMVFAVEPNAEKPVSLDRRLRESLFGTIAHPASQSERQEHIALLARWFYSTWRDGEWLPFRGPEDLNYRKLVNMIHRIANL